MAFFAVFDNQGESNSEAEHWETVDLSLYSGLIFSMAETFCRPLDTLVVQAQVLCELSPTTNNSSSHTKRKEKKRRSKNIFFNSIVFILVRFILGLFYLLFSW